MARIVTHACAWLLLAAAPFHALTALYLDGRGPAHFHKDAAVNGQRGHDHIHPHVARHGHYAHVHEHLLPERHHHPAGDPTVAVAETGAPNMVLAIGWSSTMVAALVPAASRIRLSPAASVRHANPQSFPASLLFTRFERPPRASHA